MHTAGTDWKLVVAIIAATIAAVSLVVNILQWRWNRRPSFGEWEIDEQYRIDMARDRTRFPATFEQQNPEAGGTGILVKFTYRGRHSYTVIGLIYEWNFRPFARIRSAPRILHDGESWEGLIFTREAEMTQITAVIVEGEGGRLFRQEIHRDYHERMEMHTGQHV